VSTQRGAPHIRILGAGLCGALLAVLLGQRGWRVSVHERRADSRLGGDEHGRSINLALAARGLRGLREAGLLDAVQPILMPMRGRAVHELTDTGARTTTLLPYGQRPHELIYSVSRSQLNRVLIDAAARLPGVTLHFRHTCTGLDVQANRLVLRDAADGGQRVLPLGPTIAADGAGSAARRALQMSGLAEAREELLDHDYKELTIAPAQAQGLTSDALHIWPCGDGMLIALPNPDLSFTATLFMARSGRHSFETLDAAGTLRKFFAEHFPGALERLPDLESQYAANPRGLMGTVHCEPWHAAGRLLLIGDAAHAIVPFHGQGMNCAFEDCVELLQLLPSPAAGPIDESRFAHVFAEFERRRRPDAAAIAQMALENYADMRDRVRDPRFRRLQQLAHALERRHPDRFVPRYSMVMFHDDIPYAEALRRGERQQALLERLDARAAAARADAPALDEAATLDADAWIAEHLPPLTAGPSP
jgi:kynurenine 3-monooxygenase